MSRTDNIANNVSSVNNNDTKFSLDVDEFDERNYNVINTTGLKDYASLKHEVMTWDNIKHLNQVHCISIDDRFYLYKMLDNETKDIIIYKAKKRTRSEYNAIRRAYGRGFNGNTVSISELIESNRNSSNDNSNIFRYEQGKLDNNDKFDNQKIRAKRESDGRGIAENDNNDNLSEEKYSRDVDYSEYLEFKYDFEKVNQLVFYMLKTQKKNQLGAYPRRFRHLLLVLQLVYLICLIMSILYCFKVYLTNIIIRNSFEK